ncbi:hypothetical protein [Paraburkholderia sp. SIMBA_053]|uniref:hypothetical protein n=1 Tax=Paraburkholderia sp. SIMBA_053 TaxID=3085794 RepID=UPI00397854F2
MQEEFHPQLDPGPRQINNMPLTIHTLSNRAPFQYEGSLAAGFHFWIGADGTHEFVAPELLERLIGHFRAQAGPVAVGASRDNPPAGSIGAWLIENRPGRQLASYVAAALVEERIAVMAGDRLAFPAPTRRNP